ncbi:MAG: uridine kinase [Planctomycetota bacterium]
MIKPTFIAIAGGSGSGKSTLVDRLVCGRAGSRIAVVAHDAYYLDGTAMPEELRASRNWDHPDALDIELVAEHLDALASGLPVDVPEYDFSTHSRTDRTRRVEPRPVVVVEGVLVLAVAELRARCDLRVYVDTAPEERLARRVLRDTRERGRSIESVIAQFRASVRPMHDALVEPSRAHAHVVVPWDWEHDPTPAVELLEAFVLHSSGR